MREAPHIFARLLATGLQTMRLFFVTLLLLLATTQLTYAKKHNNSLGHHNHHHHGGHHGYMWPAIVSHYLGVSTLVALKVKVVLVAVALLAGAAWFFYFHQAKLGCSHPQHHVYHDPPPPPPHHYEERPHRKRYRPHKHGRGLDVADVFTGKTSFANLTFDVLNIESESCRKKFVCDLDMIATYHPLFQSAVDFISGGLDLYRAPPTSNLTEDCTLRFPDCSLKFHRRDLTSFTDTITIFPTIT